MIVTVTFDLQFHLFFPSSSQLSLLLPLPHHHHCHLFALHSGGCTNDVGVFASLQRTPPAWSLVALQTKEMVGRVLTVRQRLQQMMWEDVLMMCHVPVPFSIVFLFVGAFDAASVRILPLPAESCSEPRQIQGDVQLGPPSRRSLLLHHRPLHNRLVSFLLLQDCEQQDAGDEPSCENLGTRRSQTPRAIQRRVHWKRLKGSWKWGTRWWWWWWKRSNRKKWTKRTKRTRKCERRARVK